MYFLTQNDFKVTDGKPLASNNQPSNYDGKIKRTLRERDLKTKYIEENVNDELNAIE